MAGREKRTVVSMVVGPFRMAFPALLEPEKTDSGERFKMTALFPPDSKDVRKIEDAMYDVMEKDFGPKSEWPRGRNDMLPEDKFYPAERNDKWAGFVKGWMALPMSAQEAPGIIDADKNEVMSKREIYGGRWARAQIVITTYDNKSRGVGVYMNHVQLLDHDEAFSGRGRAEDAFDKYEMRDRRDTRDTRDDDRGRDRDRDDRSRDREDTRDRGRDDRSRDRGQDDRDRPRERERDDDRRPSRDRDDTRDNRRDERPSRRDTERDNSRDRDSRDDRDRGRDRDDGRDRGRDDRGRGRDDWN